MGEKLMMRNGSGVLRKVSQPGTFWRLPVGVGLLLGLGLGTGCATHAVPVNTNPVAETVTPPSQPRPPTQRIEGETQQISASPDPAVGLQAFGAEELFFEGQKLYGEENFTGASEIFQRIIRDFSNSRYFAPALLMEGRVRLDLKQPQEALAPFQQYLDAFPNGRQKYSAYLGLGDAHAALNDWTGSEQDFQKLLALTGLTTAQKDAGKARLGRAQIEQGRFSEQETVLEDVANRNPPFLRGRDEDSDSRETGAIARFYVAEILRLKAENVALDGGSSVEAIQKDLEQKSQLTLDAHEQYYRTFSYSLPDYTAKAAYRMANLYERFYNDVMAAPPPKEMSEEDVVLYKEMLDEKLGGVVKKAYDLYGQVIRHADHFGLKGEYVQMCQDGMTRLEARVQQLKATPAPSGKHAKAGG